MRAKTLKALRAGIRNGTPYDAWSEHQWAKHPDQPHRVHCAKCGQLAQAELAFLESLLPQRKARKR